MPTPRDNSQVFVVIVCGGRTYRNAHHVFKTLDKVHAHTEIVRLVHGDATGADALADAWAIDRGIEVRRYPAEWSVGRAAGPIRNERMLRLEDPNLVIAFPGGAGTADMKRRAEAAGVRVLDAKELPHA